MFALLSAFEVLHPFLLGVVPNYVPVSRAYGWLEANVASLFRAWNCRHGSWANSVARPNKREIQKKDAEQKDKLLLLARTNEKFTRRTQNKRISCCCSPEQTRNSREGRRTKGKLPKELTDRTRTTQ
jgi:hypothetical protein